MDEDAVEGDVRVEWAEAQSLRLTLNANSTPMRLTGGEVVFTPDPQDPGCEAACAITLKRLSVTIEDLFFVSDYAAIEVKSLTVAVTAPLALENADGTGHVVPTGTPTQTCATVDGILSAQSAALLSDARLTIRTVDEALSFAAVLPPKVLGADSFGCAEFSLVLDGSLSGAMPFAQNPLRAADQ